MPLRRFSIAVACGVSILAGAFPGEVAGHSPTEGKREYLADNHLQWYHFTTPSWAQTPPSWLQTNVNSALLNDWDVSNVTRSPFFALYNNVGMPELAAVHWGTPEQRPDTPECPAATFFYACTDYLANGTTSDRWASTVFNSANPSGALESYWCESTAQVGSTDGCFDTRRVTLHEAGHAVGLSRTSNGHAHFPGGAGTNPDYSVMHDPPIPKPTAGYNQRWLGTCDLLSLAIDYDIDSPFTDTYPGCGDHLGAPAAQNGDIDTTTTQSTSSVVLRAGQSFSFTGTLKIVTASILGELSANGLAGRTVTIYRRTTTGSYASYTTATVASGEGGSWTRSISNALSTTFVFQARYTPNSTDDPTLDGDSSGVEKTVIWDDC